MRPESACVRSWLRGRARLATAALGVIPAVWAASAAGQIVTDGSVGRVSERIGPDYTIPASLGTRSGGNLFHSFQVFNVNTGETATFLGDDAAPGLSRIFARVTGGGATRVDGLITVASPGTSLYLINPAGIVVGPNGTFDVPGSLVLTTADSVRFADGGVLHADLSKQSAFSSAEPAAFGFLGATRGGVRFEADPNRTAIGDFTGRSVNVVAGDIAIASRRLVATGGAIRLVTATGGDVAFNPDDLAATPFPPGRDGTITVENKSELLAVTGGGVFVGGGDVTVRESAISTQTDDVPGRPIVVRAQDVTVDQAQLSAGSNAGGAGGGIDAYVAGTFSIAGQYRLSDVTLTNLNADSNGTGRGGDITIRAGTLDIGPDGAVATNVNPGASGRGGNIVVDADIFTIRSEFKGGVGSSFTGLSATSEANALASAGNITVTARDLSILDNGQISSTAKSRFGFRAGDITVVAERFLLDGTNGDPTKLTGIDCRAGDGDGNDNFISKDYPATGFGDGGNLTVTAGELTLVNGGTLSATAFGQGTGGNVKVTADKLTIRGGVNADFTGIYSRGTSKEEGNGGAGTIDVLAGRIDLSNAPVNPGKRVNITTETTTDKAALSVTITTRAGRVANLPFARTQATNADPSLDGSVTIADGATIDSRSGPSEATGKFTPKPVSGPAGAVTLDLAGDLRLRTRGQVSVVSIEPDVNAGNVSVTTTGSIFVDGDATLGPDARGGVLASSGGSGGNISLLAGRSIISTGGVISAEAREQAGSGQVLLDAKAGVLLLGASLIDARAAGQDLPVTIPSTAFFVEPTSQILTDNPAFTISNDIIREIDPAVAVLSNAAAQLQPLCGVRVTDVSSFVTLGQGGRPPGIGGFFTPKP
jgi:filamentous hemagglutinin family protein